jgi:hypothetical protein
MAPRVAATALRRQKELGKVRNRWPRVSASWSYTPRNAPQSATAPNSPPSSISESMMIHR